MGDLHAVLGAGGGIGGELVRLLAGAGRRVRAVARRPLELPRGVEQRTADLRDAEQTAAAIDGAAVVYHCAMPAYNRWPQEFPDLTRAIAAAAVKTGSGLVVADNLYAAAAHGMPIREDEPAVEHGPKARTRVAMARELLARPGLRVTFGRAADYYGPGPGALSSIPGITLFQRAVAGEGMRWPGRLDEPHVLHHLPDLARALIVLGDSDVAWGRAWNLPSPPPLSGRGYARAAGAGGRVVALPRLALQAAGLFLPAARGVSELFWQFDRPFLVDHSAFDQAFGPLPLTPHPDAVAATVRAHRARR